MNQDEMTMREKLVTATIELIERDSIDTITIRSIAKEAEVNSAAINYYFGTKENLLEAALKATLNHAFSDLVELLQREENPGIVLQMFFEYLLEGGIEHHGVTKAHLFEPFLHNNYEGIFKEWFDSVLEQLLNKFKALMPAENEDKLRRATVQVTSIVLFPVIFPDLFGGIAVNFHDKETRQAYVKELIERHFQLC